MQHQPVIEPQKDDNKLEAQPHELDCELFAFKLKPLEPLSNRPGVCMIFKSNSSNAMATPSLVLALVSMNKADRCLAYLSPSSLVTWRPD